MLNTSAVCKRSKDRMVVGWVTAFAVAIIATFGATPTTSAQDIWRSPLGVVKIVDAEKTSSNQHPISFSDSDVYFALRALKVQKKSGLGNIVSRARGNKRSSFLFLDDDARTLTPFLVQAFRQAGRGQDVFFSLKSSRGGTGQQLLASSSVVTSGRAFYRGNRLNIIFGSALNDAGRATGAVDSSANRFGIRKTRKSLQGRDGSRSSKSRIAVDILATDSVKLARLHGKVRNDWVVVGLDSATQAGAGQIGGQRQQAATPSVAQSPAASAAPARARSSGSAEQQLAKLKSLRDKGLVTEEAYQAQILKILDRSL
ncbi:MAG: SHOCT domain-containing protein [Hyphomicrobiales bacterium]